MKEKKQITKSTPTINSLFCTHCTKQVKVHEAEMATAVTDALNEQKQDLETKFENQLNALNAAMAASKVSVRLSFGVRIKVRILFRGWLNLSGNVKARFTVRLHIY